MVSTTTSPYQRPYSYSTHTSPFSSSPPLSVLHSSSTTHPSSSTTRYGNIASLPQSFPPRRHSSSSLFNFGTDPKHDLLHKGIKSPRSHKNRHRGKLGAGAWRNLKELLERPREITSKPGASHRYDREIKISCSIKTLLTKLEEKFRLFQLIVRPEGIRLTGGGASCVLSLGNESQLNDLDLTFYLDDDRRGSHNFADVLLCEEEVLSELVEEQLGIRLSLFEIYQLFFRESFRIGEKHEAWSLFRCGSDSLGIDIRVVERNRRNFVFSIDSFEIILDPMLKDTTAGDDDVTPDPDEAGGENGGYSVDAGWIDMAASSGEHTSSPKRKSGLTKSGGSGTSMSTSTSTTKASRTEVEVECNYGDFKEACIHLHTKQLRTWDPGSVRRGLFRYCLELAKGNRPSDEDKQRLEAIFVEELYHEFAAWTNDGDEFQRSIHKFLHTHQRHGFQLLTHLHTTLRNIEPPPTVTSSLQQKMITVIEETMIIYYM